MTMMEHCSVRVARYLVPLVLIAACTAPLTEEELTPPVCVVPTQQCMPQRGPVRAIDTTSTRFDKPWYYTISPVVGINTLADEWAVWYWSRDTVYATVERNGKQQVQQYVARFVNRFRLIDNLLLPFRHYGSITADREHRWIAFAAVAPATFWFDADLWIVPLGRWERRKSLALNSTRSWESQPAMDPEGRALFFASDRGDSVHGIDLWFTVWLGDRWSEPLSVGPVINTDCDELTPFITPDRQWLLFASTGHRNVGGYDLFRSRIHSAFWQAVDQGNIARLQDSAFLAGVFTPPENLGTPINTPYDELFPYTPASPDSVLYYASNQREQTGFDLYVFYKRWLMGVAEFRREREVEAPLTTSKIPTQHIEPPVRHTEEEVSDTARGEAIVEGTVVDPQRRPVSDAAVRAVVEDTVYAKTTTDPRGKFQVPVPKAQPVTIEAEAPGYFPRRTTVVVQQDTLVLADTAVQLQHFLIVRIHFPTDEYRHPYPYVLDDNGFPTNETWQALLDRVARSILQDTANLQRVLIVGHTDDVASEQYNYQLGLRRANFVFEQLYRRGVPLHLMKVISKGEMEKLPRKPGEPLKLYRTRLRRAEIIKVPKK